MTYIALSVCCTSILFILFKLFKKYQIDTFQAIVSNYIIAVCIGVYNADMPQNPIEYIIRSDWLLAGIVLGVLFISIFYLMGYSSQKIGVSITSVATKMSLAIPVLFLIISDTTEQATPIKYVGFLLALIGVYLTVKSKNNSSKSQWIIPLIIFAGSGIIDTTLAYSTKNLIYSNIDKNLFSISPFFFALIIGCLILIYRRIKFNKKLQLKNIIAGQILGIFNFGSIYWLITGLKNSHFNSSTTISINNISVVILSTLLALFLYQERLNLTKYIGIAISLIAILLITIT